MSRRVKGSTKRKPQTVSRVAREYDCSERTVHAACQLHGVSTKRPTGSGRTLRILREIVAAIDQGKGAMTLSFAEIGEACGGVSKQRVSQVYTEAVDLSLVKTGLTLKVC